MKVPVYLLNGKSRGQISLARAFSEPVRRDLIRKAFLAEQAKNHQRYGVNVLAGKRTSAHYHGRRGARHSMMNREIARMKRIHGSGFLHHTARFVPQAVKGRKAHPPKTEKKWERKINKKEERKALYSAIAATGRKDIITGRGHSVGGVKSFPIVLDDKIQGLSKIKEFLALMGTLGLKEELARAERKKVRAGKGTNRGRRYKKRKGPLLVIKEDKGISKTVKNVPGLDTVVVKKINIGVLAPGAEPGRLTLWTKSAMESLDKIGGKNDGEKGKETKEGK